MLRKRGFTLIEMMVVVLIVAILATAAVPILRGRIDAAKWAEGKAFMGTIATGIRTYVALNDRPIAGGDKDSIMYSQLGLIDTDFDGKYFTKGNFDWIINFDPVNGLTYEVEAWATGTGITYPHRMTLNESGIWVEGIP